MIFGIVNWLIFAINCCAVAIMCVALSRWLTRMERGLKDVLAVINDNKHNILVIHIENLRLQIDKAIRDENYEIIEPLNKELKRSLELYRQEKKEDRK